jgi:hypothetical protein
MTAVEVQLAPVVPGAAHDPLLTSLLSDGERDAVRRLGFAADRDRAVTARAAARLDLARRLGVHPQRVPLEMTERGPVVRGGEVELSWSHSGAWVALAFARGRRVGVDIELVPEAVPLKALARLGLCSLEEFVEREAAGKAAGEGLAERPPPGVWALPFAAPVGYVGAVAAPGTDWTMRVTQGSQEAPAAAAARAVGIWDLTDARSRVAAQAVRRA